MKITALFMVLAGMHLSAASLSQTVTLRMKEQSLSSVFETIEKQTGYVVIYSDQLISSKAPVSITVEKERLENVLRKVLYPRLLTFTLDGTSILVKEQPGKYAVDNETLVQDRLIRGLVTDHQGKPFPGVNVRLKGTSSAAITSSDGTFNITVSDANSVLVFSFLGFGTVEQRVGPQNRLTVTLQPQEDELDEVVVIGYGEVRRQDLTGSVGEVKVEDMAKAPVVSFTEALAGRIAGVQVSANDGQPGSEPNIVIRGGGSLTQSNAPLYVIDGMPLEDFDGSALNSNDIASLTVLKDASATAIYGARAANGVIVIETKKGVAGKPVVDFSTRLGTQTIRKTMELMDAYEFVKYQSELNPTVANNFYLADGMTVESYRDIVGVDMQDHLFRAAPVQMYDLSVRGGTEKTRYSVSGALNNHQSVILNTGAKRQQARISLEQEISNTVKVGVIANYSNNRSFGVPAASSLGTNNPTNYLFANAWGYRPVSTGGNVDFLDDMVDEDIISSNLIRVNPVIAANNAHRIANTEALIANSYLTYAIRDDLTLKVTASNNRQNVRGDRFNNSLTAEGAPNNPANIRGINGGINYAQTNTWSNENTLTYQKTFASEHQVNALAGFSMQESIRDGYGLSVTFLPNEELGMAGFDEGTPATVSASESSWGLMSFFGRVNYNFSSRYLATFTLRRDGSSKFSKESRWGYFPSGAVAWNMKNEKFLQQVPAISASKIRVSYGVTGNNRLGDFSRLSRISFPLIASVHYNNSPTGSKSVALTTLGNSDLKWESTEMIDLGYDLGLFQNKLELTVDLYSKTTRDLLLNARMPYMTGYQSAFKNIGTVRNEGLEVTLNLKNIQTPSFSWETNFNIGFNRSKVLALTENQTVLLSNTTLTAEHNNSPLWIAEVGQPVAVFHGYVFDGVYQYSDFDTPSPDTYLLKSNMPTNGNTRASIRPGDIKYRDLNNDGVVNAYDQTVIGRAMPIHVGGFTNNFTYKGVSLGIFFQWSYGNQIYNANRLMYEGNATSGVHINQFKSYEDRWTPDNPTNKNFRTGGQGPFGRHSTRVLEDGSYLRLKTVQAGYRLPQSLTRRAKIDHINLTVSAQNLFTITNYSGMDPEVSVRNSALTPGFDYSAYPHARTIVFGLNIVL